MGTSNFTTISKLVRPENLNHHGTLFAGVTSMWFVEGAFIEASRVYGDPTKIVCIKVHGMKFIRPGNNGDIVQIESVLAHVGKTSLTIYTKIYKRLTKEQLVDGFVTFVTVDEKGKSMPHGINYKPSGEEEQKLWNEVERLKHSDSQTKMI
ncbi:MAG TPA: hotdog domain-containing protein [Methanofastidiosum sp.]|nr:hotdog domain-containing protein [Methanofastidiosum sp.]HOI77001.1 hotdog domain-containing protein [Methanofastidiosum sp.]